MDIPTVQKCCLLFEVKVGVIMQSILDVVLFLCLVAIQSQINPINVVLIVFYVLNVVAHVVIIFAVLKPIQYIILIGVFWNGFKIFALMIVPIVYGFIGNSFIAKVQTTIFWYFFVAVEFYFWVILYSFHKGNTTIRNISPNLANIHI